VKSGTDSPHGPDLKVSCTVCHSSKGWQLDKDIYSFDHNTTKMPLIGQHASVNCKICHPTLVFSNAKKECVDCHNDVHNKTLGVDCDRCHTPSSWIVSNVKEIHQQSRFPLIGVHSNADCFQCHKAENVLRYDIVSIECVDCHRAKYMASTRPSHTSVGFSTECAACHFIYSYEWAGSGFNHNFFPLNQGHAISDCAKCHKNNSYTISTDCFSCHENDYNTALNPNHIPSGFPTNCSICHTLAVGWSPAEFKQHDSQYFPITTGKHKGIKCNVCHTNSSNYSVFTCTDCHEHNKSSMDNKHDGEGGYSYNSSACYNCHPRGEAGDK
jgi:hypothetical protein